MWRRVIFIAVITRLLVDMVAVACPPFSMEVKTNSGMTTPYLLPQTPTTVAYIHQVFYRPAYLDIVDQDTIYGECGHSVFYNTRQKLTKRVRTSFHRSKRTVMPDAVSQNNEYPWSVLLQFSNSSQDHIYCPGSIIEMQWIVTSASCLEPVIYSDSVSVLFGSGNFFNVTSRYSVHLHPNYSPMLNSFDIGLLQLHIELDFSSWAVQPICLPSAACDSPCSNQNGQVLELATWKNHVRQKAYLPLVQPYQCQSTDYPLAKIHDDVICAGYAQGGIGVCQEDNGSPLMCVDRGRFTLTGISTLFASCGQSGTYNVFTKICMGRPWIDEAIKAYSFVAPRIKF